MSVSIDLRGLPEVQKMLGQFTDREMVNRTRRALRGSAGVFRKRMRGAGQMGWPSRPKTFRKTRTRNHRTPLGVSVSPQSPLSNIFEGGAKAHAIPIGRGPFAGRLIQHPGVAARPFVGPIFDAAKREAEGKFTDDLFEGVR